MATLFVEPLLESWYDRVHIAAGGLHGMCDELQERANATLGRPTKRISRSAARAALVSYTRQRWFLCEKARMPPGFRNLCFACMSGVDSVACDGNFKCYHQTHQGAKSAEYGDLWHSYVDELGGSVWADPDLAEATFSAARDAANFKAQAFCGHTSLRALRGVEPTAARARDIEALIVLACPHGQILLMFDIRRGGESLVHSYVALLLLRRRLKRLADAGFIEDVEKAMPKTVAGDTACQYRACFENIEKGMRSKMQDSSFLAKRRSR